MKLARAMGGVKLASAKRDDSLDSYFAHRGRGHLHQCIAEERAFGRT
jgi:hypothetical protein